MLFILNFWVFLPNIPILLSLLQDYPYFWLSFSSLQLIFLGLHIRFLILQEFRIWLIFQDKVWSLIDRNSFKFLNCTMLFVCLIFKQKNFFCFIVLYIFSFLLFAIFIVAFRLTFIIGIFDLKVRIFLFIKCFVSICFQKQSVFVPLIGSTASQLIKFDFIFVDWPFGTFIKVYCDNFLDFLNFFKMIENLLWVDSFTELRLLLFVWHLYSKL